MKTALLSLLSGIVLFFLFSFGFLKLFSSSSFFLGVPLQFVTSGCDGAVYVMQCGSTPIFHWFNAIADIVFWSVISYLLIKLVRSKSKKY